MKWNWQKPVPSENSRERLIRRIRVWSLSEVYIQKLIELKDRPNGSKGKGLKYDKLEMQTYLWSDKLSLKEAKLLFKIRTRMLDVKTNFKNKYITNSVKLPEAIYCSFCLSDSIEDQEHIIDCEAFEQPYKIRYTDLFSQDLKIVAENIKKYEALWKQRCDETKTII